MNNIKAQDIVSELLKLGLSEVSVSYDHEQQMLFYDLNTKAKSALRLYEDFHLEGRYGYTNNLNVDQDMLDILDDLFYEFKKCLHGRDFYNTEWMIIGEKLRTMKND